MQKKVLILGVNGFIGESVARKILCNSNYKIEGIDIDSWRIAKIPQGDRFRFYKFDALKNKALVEEAVKNSDIVLPLIAVATPSTYIKNPLFVYNLDFELNADIIKMCVRHKKRVVFPSTSEVYGMCPDESFDEYESNFVLGPIKNERWIYSCIKQMLDRLIWAYGKHEGLQFTLFRPFNFIGPKLDNVNAPNEGDSRVLTQFIHNILNSRALKIVNGGMQKRCFTFIDDGADCIMKILQNDNGCADSKIFNIGNPNCEYSIKELAVELINTFSEYPQFAHLAENVVLEYQDGVQYYGEGYQDMSRRIPNISQARNLLGWEPKTSLKESLRLILDYHLLKKDYEASIQS